jgi:hypothetical protein
MDLAYERHGTGLHFESFGSFLKLLLVMNGCVR